MSSSSAQQIPTWLAKHTSQSYIYSVYRCLADRESEREVARYLSRAPDLLNDAAAGPSKRSKRMHLPKMFGPSGAPSHYSVAIGFQPENQHRNRYLDVEPYDRTRVVVDVKKRRSLDGKEANTEGKYLNASWVLEGHGHKWWIATQAPLPYTAHTFLSLLLQSVSPPPKSMSALSSDPPRVTRIRTIVQLTMTLEHGRRKAHPYFPTEVGKSQTFLPDDADTTFPIKVTLLNTRSIEEAQCIQSTLHIVPVVPSRTFDNGNESPSKHEAMEQPLEGVTVRHMLYTSWPDHGIPAADDRESLLAFLQLVDSTNRDVSLASSADPDPPIVVGCSAGIGRTGSFIALSSLLRSFGLLPAAHNPAPPSVLPSSPLGTLPRALNDDLVAQEVDSLREQRPGMVQRDEQILLIYEILTSALNVESSRLV